MNDIICIDLSGPRKLVEKAKDKFDIKMLTLDLAPDHIKRKNYRKLNAVIAGLNILTIGTIVAISSNKMPEAVYVINSNSDIGTFSILNPCAIARNLVVGHPILSTVALVSYVIDEANKPASQYRIN